MTRSRGQRSELSERFAGVRLQDHYKQYRDPPSSAAGLISPVGLLRAQRELKGRWESWNGVIWQARRVLFKNRCCDDSAQVYTS